MRSFLVTGGAGFIGSHIAAELARRYPQDKVVVCDYLGNADKWRNIDGVRPDEIISPNEMFYWLESEATTLEAIIHMGALSATTITDADAAMEVNITLPKILRNWSIANKKRFIYASSASTYGAGEYGFDDTMELDYLAKLKPLNTYAWSKCAFDHHVARSLAFNEPQPEQSVGLKFFNVYGPNEYHKDDQQSVIAKIFPSVQAGDAVKLFKSYHPDYADGGQLRDFIYVKDCVEVVLWMLENKHISGMFNVGTGQARSFEDLAKAAFTALGKQPNIEYIEMPETLRPRYQYYTQADITRLREAGYDRLFTTLEEGVADYVTNYLNTDNPYIK